jgi:hypothetical protein
MNLKQIKAKIAYLSAHTHEFEHEDNMSEEDYRIWMNQIIEQLKEELR